MHEMLQSAMPSLLTVIAPRHPDRGDAISALLSERRLGVSRRSAHEAVCESTNIYLADTIGELGLFYSLAPLSFIGGSLVQHGGQNPIEAVKLGSGILSGPHTFNFQETYTTLQRYQGYRLIQGTEDTGGGAPIAVRQPGRGRRNETPRRCHHRYAWRRARKTLDALMPYLRAASAPPEPKQPGLIAEHAA